MGTPITFEFLTHMLQSVGMAVVSLDKGEAVFAKT